MFMTPPPAVRTRFSDWPLAVKSILGFWFFYALTVVALSSPVLRVTVSGGGPIGLAFALLLEELLGTRVSVT